jgi:prepilin-type N-terminal cleavage/methylation domain-containing protein
MFDRVRAARNKEGGFTLIELLIVIVILGILAAVVVFSVKGIQDRGQVAACKAEFSTVSVAEEANYAKFTAWADGAGLVSHGFLRTPPTLVTADAGTGVVAYVAGGVC